MLVKAVVVALPPSNKLMELAVSLPMPFESANVTLMAAVTLMLVTVSAGVELATVGFKVSGPFMVKGVSVNAKALADGLVPSSVMAVVKRSM